MSILTIRLPDDKHGRLRELAKARSVSVNKLMDELATIALANHDARTRFEVRAARGEPDKGLALLARLDQEESGISGPSAPKKRVVRGKRRDLTQYCSLSSDDLTTSPTEPPTSGQRDHTKPLA